MARESGEQTVADAGEALMDRGRFSLGRVSPDTEPEEELNRLLASSHHGQKQSLDAIVLDADEWGFENVIEWIRRFHEAYLKRQAESSAGAWVNALQPTRIPSAVPPALVVVASPNPDNETTRTVADRIAAAGAVVYEKPPSASFDDMADQLRTELAEVYSRFWTDGRGFLPVGLEEPEEPPGSQDLARGPSDLAAYVDPVFRLSEKDFEALLDRGRIEDPLEVGE